MKRLIARLQAYAHTQTGRIVTRDAAVSIAAGYAVFQASGEQLTYGAAAAAGMAAFKLFLRKVIPDLWRADTAGITAPGLPPVVGRKGGALPSPRDDRDHQAKLPAKIPSSVNYGVGITWRMLLNDRLGDCYEAAFLHAIQVLTGYTPTDDDALALYEQVTGYDPARTAPDGSNPTDQGTYGRLLFDWARQQGLIKSYAAVPTTAIAVKAAIAKHKAVLCEWALPAGAELEGDVWTVPRRNKAAGSWGYHATVEVGYTTRRNRNVTWGEEGTVTPTFEGRYLQAGWVIEVAPGTDVAAIMAKVRGALVARLTA